MYSDHRGIHCLGFLNIYIYYLSCQILILILDIYVALFILFPVKKTIKKTNISKFFNKGKKNLQTSNIEEIQNYREVSEPIGSRKDT